MAKTIPVVVNLMYKVNAEGLTMSDLVNRFRFHKANEATGVKHSIIRQKCYELALELNEMLPDGREKSLVVTKIEEAMFWANAAIARDSTKVNDGSN